MLALDDPGWSSLQTRNGDGRWVPGWLRFLLKAPNDISRYQPECYDLCSDENRWSAAFAAFPYIVEAAEKAEHAARWEYICHLAAIVRYHVRNADVDACDSLACPEELEDAFRDSIAVRLPMAAAMLPDEKDELRLALLLAAVANFQACPRIADGIVDLVRGAGEEIAF
jgi:hypothetical protein